MPTYLHDDKVTLRAIARADAARITPWLNDREVLRHIDWWRPLTVEREVEHLDALARSEKDVAFAMVDRKDGELVGVTGLHGIDPLHRKARFGIVIGDKTRWGHGLGTSATRLVARFGFETLNLHRIFLHVHEDNARGIRAYEKVGFKREGVLRQDKYVLGRWLDVVVMGLLRDELDGGFGL